MIGGWLRRLKVVLHQCLHSQDLCLHGWSSGQGRWSEPHLVGLITSVPRCHTGPWQPHLLLPSLSTSPALCHCERREEQHKQVTTGLDLFSRSLQTASFNHRSAGGVLKQKGQQRCRRKLILRWLIMTARPIYA